MSSLLNSNVEVIVPLVPNTFGETPVTDLLALAAIVRLVQPAQIFEFGTFTGLGTVTMALNAPTSKVQTLDLPPLGRDVVDGINAWERTIDDSRIGVLWRSGPLSERIQQLYSDSRKFDTVGLVGQFDLVFIDGCHEDEFVRNDTNKAIEILRDGGVLVWHDFSRACPAVRDEVIRRSAEYETFIIDGTQVAFASKRTNANLKHLFGLSAEK